MGDFRFTIEGVGNHGCGRGARDGTIVVRCGDPACVDCALVSLTNTLRQRFGSQIVSAKLEHWPVPGAAGTERKDGAGPVDDLVTRVRHGQFAEAATEAEVEKAKADAKKRADDEARAKLEAKARADEEARAEAQARLVEQSAPPPQPAQTPVKPAPSAPPPAKKGA